MLADRRRGVAVAGLVMAAAALAAFVAWPTGPGELPVAAATGPAMAAAAAAAPAVQAAAVAPPSVVESTACPLQSMQISSLAPDPQTVCVSDTAVEQTGNIRSHRVSAGGVPGWTLRVDTVESELHAVVLQSRDGRSLSCEAGGCGGVVQLDSHAAGGLRAIRLSGVRVDPAQGGDAALLISARLRVPPTDSLAALACQGPGLTLSAPDGSRRRFCGQAGSAIEFGEGGRRIHRISDHEGRTLVVEVDDQQRVIGVALGAFGCRAAGCSGASMTAATPQKELGEHSFFFGRTLLQNLRAGAAPNRPGLVLDGSLTVAAQE